MKNKICIIFLFIFIFSIFITDRCFAIDSSVLPSGMYDAMSTTDKSYFKNYSYYLLFADEENGVYELFYAQSSIKFTKGVNEYGYSTYTIGMFDDCFGRYLKFSYDSDTDTYSRKDFKDFTYKNTITISDNSTCTYSIIDANFIVVDSETAETFFQLPLELEGTLAPVVQEITMTGVLQEILTILPLIIVLVVSFLGLRKALRMLFRLLRR